MSKEEFHAAQRHQEILSALHPEDDARLATKTYTHKLALAQKLLRITKAIGQIPRRGIAPDGWTYAKIEDVLEAVNAQLNKKGLPYWY